MALAQDGRLDIGWSRQSGAALLPPVSCLFFLPLLSSSFSSLFSSVLLAMNKHIEIMAWIARLWMISILSIVHSYIFLFFHSFLSFFSFFLFICLSSIFPFSCFSDLLHWPPLCLLQVQITRSAVLGLCLQEGAISVDDALYASRLEEVVQQRLWGYVQGAHDVTHLDLSRRLYGSTLYMQLLRMG
mgnify:CR=1 FL=1